MSVRQRAALVALLGLLGTVMLGAPALGTAPPSGEELRGDLAHLERRQQRLSGSLDAAVARLDRLEGELAVVRDDAARAAREVEQLDARTTAAQARFGVAIRERYKRAGSNDLLRLLPTQAGEVALRSHYLAAMSRHEQGDMETAAVLGRRLAVRRAELRVADERLVGLSRDAEKVKAELSRALESAAGTEAGLRDKITRSEAAVVSGGKACPQARPFSFTDTWGAPRVGGRRHMGADVFGRRGGNVYAITDGVIQFTKAGRRSGLFMGVRGDDGHAYWYMHMQDYVARTGQRVKAGQLIAHNGTTGNARGTPAHVHFEFHPGGGRAVNPTAVLRGVCG